MKLMMVLLACFLVASCQTMSSESAKNETPPEITADMDFDDAIDAAVKFGGETLAKVKKLIAQQKMGAKATAMMTERLSSTEVAEKMPESQLMNMMHLLQSSGRRPSIELFRSLVRRERQAARDLGWNIAANYPSPEIAAAMDLEFTRAVASGTEETLLLPQMALAVQTNRLTSAYTLVRLGLMIKGNDEFAKAMISLAPRRSVDDFFPYLAKATIEELRQLNQSTVNVYTCMVILQHMNSVSPTTSHPQFSQLFLYAVSRNPGLSELASGAIDRVLPGFRTEVVQLLAQQPAWVQVAYVEGTKRRRSPHAPSFLAELKLSTSHNEVSEEINEGDASGAIE
jgi:hypothetical protein